jgi:hypothetical protein
VAKKDAEIVVANTPLQDFLIALAADDDVRVRFSDADDNGQRAILADEFHLRPATIEALMSGVRGRVRARLRLSEQQASTTPAPSRRVRSSKAPKKR